MYLSEVKEMYLSEVCRVEDFTLNLFVVGLPRISVCVVGIKYCALEIQI